MNFRIYSSIFLGILFVGGALGEEFLVKNGESPTKALKELKRQMKELQEEVDGLDGGSEDPEDSEDEDDMDLKDINGFIKGQDDPEVALPGFLPADSAEYSTEGNETEEYYDALETLDKIEELEENLKNQVDGIQWNMTRLYEMLGSIQRLLSKGVPELEEDAEVIGGDGNLDVIPVKIGDFDTDGIVYPENEDFLQKNKREKTILGIKRSIIDTIFLVVVLLFGTLTIFYIFYRCVYYLSFRFSEHGHSIGNVYKSIIVRNGDSTSKEHLVEAEVV